MERSVAMRGVRRHVRNFAREKDAGDFGAVCAPWAFCYREVASFNTWRNKRVSATIRPGRQELKPAFHVHAFAARLKPGPDTRHQEELQKRAPTGLAVCHPRPLLGLKSGAHGAPLQKPGHDTRRPGAPRARACKFLHQNEPKVIDNKPDHKKRTQSY